MSSHSEESLSSEIPAIALGCIFGLFAGAGLGGCFIGLLGCEQVEMRMIVMLHSSLAMMIMGGWTAPSLLPRTE